MQFSFSAQEDSFRQHVRSTLLRPDIAELIDVANGHQADPRPLYRALGEAGLLAVNWPIEFGGLGLGQIYAGIVIEEMGLANVPDTLHLLSVQVVGSILLASGTARQKKSLARRIASGQMFACVLFTEPETGTDLAAIRTTAKRMEDGSFRISGRKRYSLRAGFADYGLCLARTQDSATGHQGLTLFLLSLAEPGIAVHRLPSLADEPFHDVVLDDARATGECVIGDEGTAWGTMLAALAFERTGTDYMVRARRWLKEIATCAGAAAHLGAAEIGLASAELEAAQLMCWDILSRMDDGDCDETMNAMAKLYNSELAQRIGWLGSELCPPGRLGSHRMLDAAHREAPGLTISAGVSEAMLETIARSHLVRPEGGAST
ncbi:acyl-CoA dehydrogenase family protein [Bradyrhizobium sp. 21]|uniref:acyl-CoA dehydrogenase family protein n=1 Tax=Bradyrhizobium sp. 21 TaxID=2782666 RepID=UPI001FF808F2|nr:acyl-CoA dehydrogenase family protein [Bradyrhizobium sp. 21]MCK1387660.1 acyl-CoA dehydrogenase family protein [Bradyrhizobium sp. 21]